MSTATPWLPWTTPYSYKPVEVRLIPSGRAPAGKDDDGNSATNVNDTVVGCVSGRRRVNQMLTSEQRDAVSESMIPGWNRPSFEDPGLLQPVMHSSQLLEKDQLFRETMKLVWWGHGNATANERYRNYYRFVYSPKYQRIVVQLTLDVSDDPTLHKAVNDLVQPDVPQSGEGGYSLRETTMATRPLNPGDLPFVTFDVLSLGILRSLPIAYWKAHHTGMRRSARHNKDIPIVEPMAVWNPATAVLPVSGMSQDAQGMLRFGPVEDHVPWLPPADFVFTAAHVSAITDCGQLFTDVEDNMVADGSQGVRINPQFTEDGPYANFGFVDGDHCNATLDNVIYGVHSSAWCARQTEKFLNARAADLDSHGLRVGERAGSSSASGSGDVFDILSALGDSSSSASASSSSSSSSSAVGNRPVRKSLWSRLKDDEADVAPDPRLGSDLGIQLGVGAFGSTMMRREFNPKDQAFASDAATAPEARMVGKTKRNPPPVGKNGEADPYAHVNISALGNTERGMTAGRGISNAGGYGGPMPHANAFGGNIF